MTTPDNGAATTQPSPNPSQQRQAVVVAAIAFWLILIIVAGIQIDRVNRALSDIDARLATIDFDTTDWADGVVEVTELQAIVSRVEATENRAVANLAYLDSMMNTITVLGLVIASVGVLAVVLGVQDYRSALQELNQAKRDFNMQKESLDQAQNDFKTEKEKLDTMRLEFEASLKEAQEQIARESLERTEEAVQRSRLSTEKANLSLSYVNLGRQQYHSGDLNGALKTYQRAVYLDPQNPVPLYHLGYVYIQQKKIEEALAALEMSYDIDDELPQTRAALGYVYRLLGEQESQLIEREEYFQKAEIKLNAALDEYDRLVDDDGESWWGVLGGLYKRRYLTSNSTLDLQEALHYYRKAERVTPQSSYPVLNQALIYLQLDEPSRTAEYFERVERSSRRTISAEVDSYWAYSDAILARLALGKDQAEGEYNDDITHLVDLFFKAMPQTVVDVIPRVLTAIDQIRTSQSLAASRSDMAIIDRVYDRLEAAQQTRTHDPSLTLEESQQTGASVDNDAANDDTSA